MMRETNDEWDGFDGTARVYDDRQEKRYQRTIWLVLAVVAGGILISLIMHHIEELRLTYSANRIDAQYYEEGAYKVAIYTDGSGKNFRYVLSDYVVHDGDAIRLYYWEDIREAEAVSTAGWWIFQYIFFGVIFGISLWRLIRIYRPKQHR